MTDFFFNVYLFLRERERERERARARASMNGGRAERKGNTESEAGCRLQAVSTQPAAGPELTNREIMT